MRERLRLRVALPIRVLIVACGVLALTTTLHGQTPQGSTNEKLSIAVLIDSRVQPMNVLDFQVQVLESLRETFVGRAVEVSVLSYSDKVQQIADWSPADSGLSQAISRIKQTARGDGGTAALLNDALSEALARLGTRNGRHKVLLVIGEGNDSGSRAKFSQALSAARKDRVRCFAFFVAAHRAWVGKVRQYGFDLWRLASKTNGKVYDVRTNSKALENAMRDFRLRLAEPYQVE